MKKIGNQTHRIIQGDSLEALYSEVTDNNVDLIFVDPPYNIGKNFNG
ncbi:MAG: RsmD family RNA methyltransferase, partial [Prevotellaceae bacterium]|nr:RsmD family RNA methyltransferase [Prevotellaceae bacterium]